MSPGLVPTIEVGFVADLLVWLTDVSVKSAILLGVALVLHRVLRGAEARVRHALWGAAFLGILVMPLVCHMKPAWRVGLWPSLSTFGVMEPMAINSIGGSGGSPQSCTVEPSTFAQGLPPLSSLQPPSYRGGLLRDTAAGYVEQEAMDKISMSRSLSIKAFGISIVLCRGPGTRVCQSVCELSNPISDGYHESPGRCQGLFEGYGYTARQERRTL